MTGEHDGDGRGDGGGGGEPDAGGAAEEAASRGAEGESRGVEDEAASRGVDPAAILRRGGPKAFLAITCGFLVLMCCLGGCVGGAVLGAVRGGNLDDVRESLGAPEGWSVTGHSAWPWGATATLSGPADAAAVESWLEALGAGPEETAEVADCLAGTEDCVVELDAGDRGVHITYHGGGETGSNATAEVVVR